MHDINLEVQQVKLPKIDDTIQYSLENGIYLNATHIAKKYDKRLDKYFTSKDTIEYLDRLGYFDLGGDYGFNSPRKGELVIAKEGRYGGTYIHEALIVHFARWINVDFAIACDLFIRNTIINKTRQTVMQELKAPKIDKDNFMSLRAGIKHYNLNIKATHAKKILLDKDILKVEKVTKKTNITRLGNNVDRDNIKIKNGSLLFKGDYLLSLLNPAN